MWRIYTHFYEYLEPEDTIEIRNVSSQKLHLVGLATRHQFASFVDLRQPGSFNLTLYPGQRVGVSPDGNATRVGSGTYYVKIQDWAVE